MEPFKMDAVLKQRQVKKEEAQTRFSNALLQKQQVEQKLLEKEDQYQNIVQKQVDLQNEGVLIHELLIYREHETRILEELVKIREHLKTKTKIADEQRQNLLSCAQKHKIMEELKDHQNLAYKQYIDKKEAEMLDEIATVRHGKTVL